jgi:hypothetical protein
MKIWNKNALGIHTIIKKYPFNNTSVLHLKLSIFKNMERIIISSRVRFKDSILLLSVDQLISAKSHKFSIGLTASQDFLYSSYKSINSFPSIAFLTCSSVKLCTLKKTIKSLILVKASE